MQHGPVRLEAEPGKNITLCRRRIGNQGQRLVCMRGHHNAVKPDIALAGDRQDYAALRAAHAGDMAVQMNPSTGRAAKRSGDAVYIFA